MHLKTLVPFYPMVSGGIARSRRRLLLEMIRLGHSFIVVLPSREIPSFETVLPPSEQVTYVPASAGHRWLPGKARTALSLLMNHHSEVSLIGKHGVTHCLYPSQLHFQHWARRLLRHPVPSAVIVSDLLWELHQGSRDPGTARRVRERNRRMEERADRLIAISRSVLAEVEELGPDARRKCRCVPWAADPEVQRPAGKAPISLDAFAFYYPARAAGNKNHLLLFRAAKVLLERGRSFRVVLTGWDVEALAGGASLSRMPRAEAARLFFLEHAKALGDRVHFLGYAGEETVEACYGACGSVVLPSLYEGFGHPLAEGLVRGLPVLCSDIGPFREQVDTYRCEDRVRFFPPDDLEALVALMEEALEGHPPRVDPGDLRSRFDAWTWADVARGYVEALESLSG
jgi:glycosyltransferase involved in cell wall biosynthesis